MQCLNLPRDLFENTSSEPLHRYPLLELIYPLRLLGVATLAMYYFCILSSIQSAPTRALPMCSEQ